MREPCRMKVVSHVPGHRELTREEWWAAARRRFGRDPLAWRFRCPSCGFVASGRDWKEAGAPEEAFAFACVGRWREGAKQAFETSGSGPCTYSGGGLFRLNPVVVVCETGQEINVFDFAEKVPLGCRR